jgi:hypothetical protein
VTFDDVRVDVDISYGPIFRLDYQPGMGLVIGGVIIALVAIGLGWTLPGLMWVVLLPEGENASVVQIQALPGTVASRGLARLASRLQRVLADET